MDKMILRSYNIHIIMDKMICYSFKMHVNLFVSCINKSYIQNLKTITKLVFFFIFKMLYPNLLIIQSKQLSES